VDRQRPPRRRRASLAQPLPAGPHAGDDPLEAETIGRLLGTRASALLCVHGAHDQGVHAQGVTIVPAHLLCGALGDDRILSDADVALLASTAWSRLRPAA
jgi:hypothetical protein